MIRVVLADDHETVREGLKLLVDSQADMEVIGEAGDGRRAVEMAQALHPTVIVLDLSMPELNGLNAMRALAQSSPATAVVALTRYSDDAYVQALLGAGASAYVLKQSTPAELLKAIRAAAEGKRYLDASLAARVAGAFMARHAPVDPPRITDRESEVLRLIAVGHSNKEIAARLDISVKTVEVHKANGMRKLGFRGRIDIVRFAVLQGWLRDD